VVTIIDSQQEDPKQPKPKQPKPASIIEAAEGIARRLDYMYITSALHNRRLYLAHVKAGFSKEEALALVGESIKHHLRPI